MSQKTISIGKRSFQTDGRPYVMGILNLTPDSFSDGGSYEDTDKALYACERMMNEGADIIDVGGESTRPGYTKISAGEEIARTCFVIEAIKERFEIPVSLDTYKSEVAQAGIIAGADMINDIWGLKADDRMAEIVAGHDTAVCLMHNRVNALYTDLLTDVVSDIKESISIAEAHGIRRERMMIDPGIGFAKSSGECLRVINELDRLNELGLPVLLGVSRKSCIGNTLNLPVDEREEGTVALNVMGLMKGASFFRVHDVKKNKRALDMAWAVMRA